MGKDGGDEVLYLLLYLPVLPLHGFRIHLPDTGDGAVGLFLTDMGLVVV